MGQYEIIKLLERSGKPLSRREIANSLKEHPRKISMRLNRLLVCGEIKFIEIDRRKALKYYGSKRRMRLYLLVK